MNTLTIVTGDELDRHQANVEAFLADSRNQPVLKDFADALFEEDITDDELIDIVMLELGMERSAVINRLAQIDFVTARSAPSEPA
jgi:hypothetical protein